MQHVIRDTATEIDAIGKSFADKYYGALVSATPGGGIDWFFGARSKYLYLRRRRPDVLVRGADAIGRFVARMNYGECALRVDTVDAIRVADRPRRYAVLTVCRLTRPRQPARRFVQSTIVEHASCRSDGGNEFGIVGTVFRFDDDDDDDDDDAIANEPSPDDTTTVALPTQMANPEPVSAVGGGKIETVVPNRDVAAEPHRPAKNRKKRAPKPVPFADGPTTVVAEESAKSRTEVTATEDALSAGKRREPSKEAIGDRKGRGGKDVGRAGSPRPPARRQKPAAAKKPPSPPVAATAVEQLRPSLYVGGLPKRYEADELRAVFGRFGAITGVGPCTAVSKKKNRPACAYYAIVQFEDPGTVDTVSRLGTVSLENVGGGRAVVQTSTRGLADAAAKPR